MRSKKSEMGVDWITKLILWGFALIILSLLVFRFSGFLKTSAEYGGCGFKNLISAKTKVSGIELWRNVCPMSPITVAMKDIDKPIDPISKKITKEMGINVDTKDNRIVYNMNRIMAKAMGDCWNKYGAGELPLYSELTTERQCAICARIKFDDDVKKHFNEEDSRGPVISVDAYGSVDEGGKAFGETTDRLSFDYWLRSHKVPGTYGKDMSYFEYLLDTKDTFAYPLYDYDVNKAYAVIFTIEYPEYFMTKAGQTYEIVKMVIGGIPKLFGKSSSETVPIEELMKKGEKPKMVAGNDLVPYDELQLYCGQIMN